MFISFHLCVHARSVARMTALTPHSELNEGTTQSATLPLCYRGVCILSFIIIIIVVVVVHMVSFSAVFSSAARSLACLLTRSLACLSPTRPLNEPSGRGAASGGRAEKKTREKTATGHGQMRQESGQIEGIRHRHTSSCK